MIRKGITVPLGLSRKQRRDHVYLYLPGDEALKRVAAPYGNQKAFFSALESAYISDMIREVEVRAKLVNGETLAFRELSEGEQQLLLVLGLLKFTQEDESLFLLDEPDTHLNPAWSIQYLDIVSRVVGYPEKSHFIITTHDPLVLAALNREQVQILSRVEDGRIEATQPDSNPRGMGVSALLTSKLFGLRSELDLPTLEMLEQKRLLSLKDALDEDDLRELARINKALEGLGFMDEDRDPLFVLWSRAMARAERDMGIDGPLLTDEQRQRLSELGNELVDDLIEAGREDS
jgi:ABC-type multidrug transport system ATPase subunit